MEPKFNFSFTQQEINTIVAGLGKLPMEAVVQLFNNIQGQFQAQVKPAAEVTAVEEAPKKGKKGAV